MLLGVAMAIGSYAWWGLADGFLQGAAKAARVDCQNANTCDNGFVGRYVVLLVAGIAVAVIGAVTAVTSRGRSRADRPRKWASTAQRVPIGPRIADDLARLAAMHEAGSLSDEEFERAKRGVLRDT